MKFNVSSRRVALLATAGLIVLASAASPAAGAPENDGDGGEISPQIIGGTPASEGAYPFMAAILDETSPGNDYDRHFCGGTLIAPNWVLTAAHCAEGANPEDLAVAVGRTVLSSNQGQRRPVISVQIHPQFFDPEFLAHDVALLELGTPVTDIAPIRLANSFDDKYEAEGTPLTIIGWGTTKSYGKPNFPDQLMQVTAPAVGDKTCEAAYAEFGGIHEPSMLCTGRLGKDHCVGDEGGPVFATAPDGSKVHMGSVSWGIGCAERLFPGVYSETNNPEIRTWIQEMAGV